MANIRGRVRKFGDNVDTDAIAPGPFLTLPMEEMKKHTFEPIHPDFYKTDENGDIIVAGNNFGCGSSREQANSVVKELGFRHMATPSGKGAYYAPSHSGLAVSYGPLEACIEAAITGYWRTEYNEVGRLA